MARTRKTDTDARSESAKTSKTGQSDERAEETIETETSPADTAPDAETAIVEPETPEDKPDSDEAQADRREQPEPAQEEAGPGQEPPQLQENAAPVPPRRGGFVPLVLGGVVAAAIGFGAAAYVLPDLLAPKTPPDEFRALNERIDGQEGRIADLTQGLSTQRSEAADKAAVGALTERADALEARLGEMRSTLDSISAQMDAQTGRFDGLEARLTELEKRPVSGGAASASALEAFGREMDALREDIATQRASTEAVQRDIEAAAQAASERVAAIADEAERLRQEADDTARTAAARAALSRLRVALDSGGALDAALADLKASGLDIPAALAEQSQGVPTMSALREAFPPAARDALGASLKETAEGDAWDRLGAFLRSQTGARSLSPRAGSDPDAVLSRAEAALKAGDLEAAVAEIDALPPEGQARMAEWIALAERRIAAMAAVDEISQTME